MSYYSRLEGTYDEDSARVIERRESIIDAAQAQGPTDLTELLAASEDGVIDHELGWAEVADPQNNGKRITVRPVLRYTRGSRPDARAKDRYDRGLDKILLEGQMPSGREHVIGMMAVFYRDGQLSREPTLNINTTDDPGIGLPVSWDSVDAELWLQVTEAALNAQS